MSSILLSTDRIKSLYFEENTEIQAFLLPTENSFNCNFAVACKEKTGKIHTNSHEIHTTIGGINVIERSQLPLRELILYMNTSRKHLFRMNMLIISMELL